MQKKYSNFPKLFLLVLFLLTACGHPTGLVIEEHAIRTMDWEGESLVFEPLEGTQAQILAQRADLRNQPTVPGQTSLTVGSDLFEAAETISDNRVAITVNKNSQTYLVVDAGVISPIYGLHGLWQTPEHWYLEVAHVEEDSDDPNAAFIIWGEVFQDGKSQNMAYGFDEAFNFQLLNGKSFFFFEKAGKMGYVFDGKQYNLPYSRIPHYQCCSAAAFNPLPSQDLVSFFADKTFTSYYVEMGIFK